MATSITSSQKSVWGFSPQSIPGLQLWLDAADTTSITGTSTVTAWRDKSGTARTVSFTGTNTYTSSPASVNTNGSTAFFQADADFRKSTVPNGSLFLVYKWNNSTAGTNQCLWGTDRGGGNNRGQVFTFPANTSIQYGLTINFSAPSFAIVSGINNGNLLIYNANYSLDVVNGTFVNVNGSLSTSLATEGAANPQTSQSAISFGCVDDTGRLPSAVSFSEIILFNTALTASQRQQVEGYLAAKWGLGMNLPPTHPYSSVIPILPSQIPGLALWLDAADTSTITGTSPVTQWNDKSGNGYNAVSHLGSVSRTTLNGLNALNFGTTGVMKANNFLWPSSFTQLFVGYVTGAQGIIIDTMTSGGAYGMYVYTGNAGLLNVNNTANTGVLQLNDSVAGPVPPTGQWFIFSIGYGSTGTAAINYTLNGTVRTTTVTAGAGGSATHPALTLYINGLPSGTLATGGAQIAEIIHFNSVLTTPQRQQIEVYLGRKWGIGVTNTTVAPGRYLIPTNRPFYPTDISGCSLWLDGADRSSMTFSPGTSNVTGWADKSGTGNNFTGSATYALSSFNNKFGLAFDGTNNYFNQASGSVFSITNTTYCIFTVHHFTTNGGPERTVYRTAVPNPGAFFRQISGRVQWLTDLDPAGYISRTASGEANSGINCINAITTTSVTAYLNGTSVGSSSKGSSTNMTFMVGQGTSGGTERLLGTIFEMIIFNNTLTTAQQQQVEQYLAWKWGLVANLPPATSHLGKLLPAFGTAFTPKSLTGMALWLDGADQTSMTFSSGSSVSSWNDKSGNGYNFTNNGGSTNPTTDPKMGLLFTTTRSFANSSVPIPSNYTLFLVGNLTSRPSSYGRMINMNTTTDGFGFLGTFNNSFNFATFTGPGGATWYDTNSNTPTSTVASSPNLSIMGMTISATSLTPFFDGNVLNSKTNSGSTASTTGMCLNGISFAGQGVNAHFAEVFLFNSPLSTSQRQQVEGYLAWKWGLQRSLPSTHAYAKFSP